LGEILTGDKQQKKQGDGELFTYDLQFEGPGK
jgi:hypothetical protein